MTTPKLSMFKNSFSKEPFKNIALEEFLNLIKFQWKDQVEKVRSTQNKKLKGNLPAITISAQLKNRDEKIPLEKKLVAHSGYICIDIDSKDNPRMSTSHIIDHECVAQFVSCRGEGLKIIYRCKPVKTIAEHWRIYDAVEERLKNKKLVIKIDSIVKSITTLQYVTYDPEPYINLKSKLIVKPLPPIKLKKKVNAKVDLSKELSILNTYIEELGKKDVTSEYEDWNSIAFGLTYSLGEAGREIFHKLSCNYKGYSKIETDEKYDSHLQRDTSNIDRPVTLATVYDILSSHVKSPKVKALQKQKGIAIGTSEGTECPDLVGMVQFKLFLFKKLIDKETHAIKALTPHSVNPIAFGQLLMSKNIFRYENTFVRIADNIVEKVDTHTILWEINEHVKEQGDYEFTYKGELFHYTWEDMLYVWKIAKANSSIANSIYSEVAFWKPNLLRDEIATSFIPYQNGVVKVTSKKIEMVPYKELKFQIWKERIIQRDFTYTPKIGMFENFFANVIGRGKNFKSQILSAEYKRGLWYFGYMLQGTKDPATARAWMLYDINVGNNGRSGKSIIGQALGKIRHVTLIDGKQVDFRNRFWLQTIQPWTDIIFIDDPKANTSILPMFNMITGTVTADRKGLIPLEIQAKFLFASNWIMESSGSSESDRQFISQLSDYYTNYAKKHADTITPIVHAHGKRFFTEWDEQDWSKFDSFCVRALQFHFSSEVPNNTIIGDSRIIQFKQKHGEECYEELNNLFKTKADIKNRHIQRDSLINYIRDRDNQTSAKEAGTIARAFLKALGLGDVKVSTVYMPNGMVINVYKWEKNEQR